MVFLTKLNPVANKKSVASLPDFEGDLKKLESILAKMEGGELTLEQALKHFEQGIQLARHCQQALDQASLRVQELMGENSQPFDAPEE